MLKLLIFCAAIAVSFGEIYENYPDYILVEELNYKLQQPEIREVNNHIEENDTPRNYKYKYGVEDHHTEDIKSHREERDGDVVRGEYSFVQPDGKTRIVTYSADKHGGFHAFVTYVDKYGNVEYQ